MCPESFRPVLSQVLVYLISRSLQNLNLCEFVCVCVCVCICVCMYKCDKSKQFFNCHMHNTISRIYLWNVTKFKKVHKLKILRICHLYMTHIFTCLKACCMFLSIKMLFTLNQSWKRILIGIFFNPFMPSGDKRSYKLTPTCRYKLLICLIVRHHLALKG